MCIEVSLILTLILPLAHANCALSSLMIWEVVMVTVTIASSVLPDSGSLSVSGSHTESQSHPTAAAMSASNMQMHTTNAHLCPIIAATLWRGTLSSDDPIIRYGQSVARNSTISSRCHRPSCIHTYTPASCAQHHMTMIAMRAVLVENEAECEWDF